MSFDLPDKQREINFIFLFIFLFTSAPMGGSFIAFIPT